jgi:hypothetical protein
VVLHFDPRASGSAARLFIVAFRRVARRAQAFQALAFSTFLIQILLDIDIAGQTSEFFVRLPSLDLSTGSRFRRAKRPERPPSRFLLLGVAFSLVGAWVGGEPADRLGVGIDDSAHLNAASSLSTPRAAEIPRSEKTSAKRIA